MDFWRALRYPAYRRVWLVATMLQFGYWFASIAFQWLVARETDSDPLSLSVIYFFMLIPMLIFSLPAGVLADTRDRRKNIFVAQVGVVAISAVTAILVIVDRAPFVVLVLCAFAAGVVQAGAVPSSQALLANAVPVEDLRSAVVLQAAGMNLTRILGPALAGIIILAFGVVDSVLAYGAMAALTLVALRGLRSLPANEIPAEAQPMLDRIRAGLRHVRERPPAGTTLLVVAGTSLLGLSYMAQLPSIAARVSPEPSLFVMLASLSAVGSGVGLIVVALRPTARPTATPAAVMLVVLGLVMAGLAFATTLWLVLLLVTIGGALQFGAMTICGSVIQSVVADDFRGRVMSLYTLAWGGLMPVGGLGLGLVWHAAGPELALSLGGAGAVLVGGSVLRPAVLRAIARMRPDPDPGSVPKQA